MNVRRFRTRTPVNVVDKVKHQPDPVSGPERHHLDGSPVYPHTYSVISYGNG